MNKFSTASATAVAQFLAQSASQGLQWTANAENAKMRLRELVVSPSTLPREFVVILSCAVALKDMSDLAASLVQKISESAHQLTIQEFGTVFQTCAENMHLLKDEQIQSFCRACPISDTTGVVRIFVQLYHAQYWLILQMALRSILPRVNPMKITPNDIASIFLCSLASSSTKGCVPYVLKSRTWGSRLSSCAFAWEYTKVVSIVCAIRPAHVSHETSPYLRTVLHRLTHESHLLTVESAIEVCTAIAALPRLTVFTQKLRTHLGLVLQRVVVARSLTVNISAASALAVMQCFSILRCHLGRSGVRALQGMIAVQTENQMTAAQRLDMMLALVCVIRRSSDSARVDLFPILKLISSRSVLGHENIQIAVKIAVEIAFILGSTTSSGIQESSKLILNLCAGVLFSEERARCMDSLATAALIVGFLPASDERVQLLKHEVLIRAGDILRDIDTWDYRSSRTGFQGLTKNSLTSTPELKARFT